MGIFAVQKKKKEELKLKSGPFILFISIFTALYLLVNYYIFRRAMQALPEDGIIRLWFTIGFWMVASAFILARIMERAYPCGFTGVITWIGSFWLAFLLYFVLLVVLVDITRVLNHFFHIYPEIFFADYAKTKLVALYSAVGIVSLVVIAGFINARTPQIRELNLHINKQVAGEKQLNIVMASDIHLGTLMAKRKASRLVQTINSLHPDIVLFAGDLVDEDLAPVIKNDLGASFCQLRSKYGTFAITGNHEYIGGAEQAVKYLGDHCITVLRDSFILVDNRFYLVGRDDRDKVRFTGKSRKELDDVMEGIDRSFPVILMDHQPFSLGKSAGLGVDLSLSGHTHHGQMWPFNYITKAIYELSWGYKQIGTTHFYVSSGFGTWGPPVRLGNRPEIVHIRLTFN